MRLFVYGSLKQGQSNDHLCRHAVVEPATLWGRLYQHPSGYPMLVLPPDAALQIGSGDPLADAALEERWSARPIAPATDASGDWRLIEGELVTFDDVAQRLPLLDDLEDFHPPGVCLYHRVLTWLHAPARLTWTYVAPGGQVPSGSVLLGDRWPE